MNRFFLKICQLKSIITNYYNIDIVTFLLIFSCEDHSFNIFSFEYQFLHFCEYTFRNVTFPNFLCFAKISIQK